MGSRISDELVKQLVAYKDPALTPEYPNDQVIVALEFKAQQHGSFLHPFDCQIKDVLPPAPVLKPCNSIGEGHVNGIAQHQDNSSLPHQRGCLVVKIALNP